MEWLASVRKRWTYGKPCDERWRGAWFALRTFTENCTARYWWTSETIVGSFNELSRENDKQKLNTRQKCFWNTKQDEPR